MVVFGESCCIRAKGLYSSKKRLYIGKSGCIREKWLYSGKSGGIRVKWLYSGKSGCIRVKLVVFRQS